MTHVRVAYVHGCRRFLLDTVHTRRYPTSLFASILQALAVLVANRVYLAVNNKYSSRITPKRPFPNLLAPERRRRDARQTTRAPTSR